MKLAAKIITLSFAVVLVIFTILFSSCKKSCNAPVISSSAQNTVNTSTYEFIANITEIDNASLIIFTVNGVTTPFSYNASTHVLIANISLNPGTNNISITANGCEVKTANFNIVYDFCNTIIVTSNAQGTVNSSSYQFSANITEIVDPNLITLTLNGNSMAFNYNTSSHILTANLILSTGLNNIVIAAKGCEAKSVTYTITYASATSRLTDKNFKLSAYTINPALPGYGSDIYSQLPSCSQDDLIRFNANYTVTNDEGLTKCNASDPQTKSDGSWAWNNTETILTISEPGSNTVSWNIITNDGTTLQASFSEVYNGVNYTYMITWIKQ
ncbi:hypothetical protein [Aurantibacillus circumpalustris]|uniref:hypothetical protein n=1 Tax=Aurantibacillus circumpalustris TaxID=3036359 RepID=UPI00295AB932|nr:hypothetical protein [Aurantibacillus circumpalustris]